MTTPCLQSNAYMTNTAQKLGHMGRGRVDNDHGRRLAVPAILKPVIMSVSVGDVMLRQGLSPRKLNYDLSSLESHSFRLRGSPRPSGDTVNRLLDPSPIF